MTYYRCKKCNKRFISEGLVNSHLQWKHDIPPRAMVEGIAELKKQLEKMEKEPLTGLDEYFWN